AQNVVDAAAVGDLQRAGRLAGEQDLSVVGNHGGAVGIGLGPSREVHVAQQDAGAGVGDEGLAVAPAVGDLESVPGAAFDADDEVLKPEIAGCRSEDWVELAGVGDCEDAGVLGVGGAAEENAGGELELLLHDEGSGSQVDAVARLDLGKDVGEFGVVGRLIRSGSVQLEWGELEAAGDGELRLRGSAQVCVFEYNLVEGRIQGAGGVDAAVL